MVETASRSVSPDVRTVEEWVETAYGLRLVDLIPIEGGLDPAARVWQGTDARRSLWCVKLNTRDVRFGLRLSEAAAAAQVPGIVAAVPTLAGEVWASRPGLMLSVSTWVDGLDGVDGGADSVPWHELGRTLRGLHDLDAPPQALIGRRGIRRRGRSPRRLLSEVDALLSDRQPTLGPTFATGSNAAVDPRLSDASQLWASERSRLSVLADAERQGKSRRNPTSRVPVHGDPHLGNIVMDGAHRSWLVDFDDATVAPREVDLMLIELGVITAAPISSEQRSAFRLGYGSDIPIDEDRVTRFACVRAIEDVTAAAHQLVELPAGRRAAALEGLRQMFGPHSLIAQTERRLERGAPPPETFPAPTQHNQKRTKG